MTPAAVLAFGGLVVLAAIASGPAVPMSARSGPSEGLRSGLMLALGIGAVALFQASAAMFGPGLLISATPAPLWALRLGGAACLLWMGWHLWRAAKTPFIVEDRRPAPRSALSAFRPGRFTQQANPTPVVMVSAIFLCTVPAGTAPWALVALPVIILAAETLWNTPGARVFLLERTRAGYISLKTVIDRSFGRPPALLGVRIAAT